MLVILTPSGFSGTSAATLSPGIQLFVSAADGDDGNAGTAESPLRTAAAAVGRAKADAMTTIVLRGGDYRESLGGISKPVTIEAYPGEEVWFKGSTLVESGTFVADGPAWRLDGWNPDICRPGADGKACVFPPDIVQGNELAGDPAMVFYNGAPLRQVAAHDQLGEDTFHWDSARGTLYVGNDPAGQVVEVSSRRYALQFLAGAENSVVRGIGFAQYATSQDYRKQPAVVISQADGVVLEDNTITLNAAAGVVANASNMRITGNEISFNGSNGVLSYRAVGLRFESNKIVGNNQERTGLESSRSLAGAGMKATYLRKAIIKDNVFEGNIGTGFWCDLSCEDVTIVGNLAKGNAKHGLYYEVSARGLIASNLMTGNGQSGLKISGSNHVRVYNNTLAGNAQTLLVAEDPRPNTDRCDADNCPSEEALARGVTWNTSDVTLMNNIFAARAQGAGVIETVDANGQASGRRVGAKGMIPGTHMDHNAYHRAGPASPPHVVTWAQPSGGEVGYPTLAGFKATGHERHGRYLEGAQPLFAGADDYRVLQESQAAEKGAPLPADIAAALEVEEGTRPPLGALRWPDSDSGGSEPTATASPSPSPTPADRQGVLRRPVHFLVHSSTGHVLMTLDGREAERAASRGYDSRGVGFLASSGRARALAPVHRLLHPTTGDRLLLTSAAERDTAVTRWGYTVEGVAFYASVAPTAGLVDIHRLQKGAYHQYVIGPAARDAAIAEGWRYEHVAFYARPPA
ncbi:hypothetical protein GCM10018965_068640 [Nonomuraea roseola]